MPPQVGESDALDPSQAQSHPWKRLREAFGYAFTKSDPDAPQPPVPQELKQWGEYTAISLGFGIAYNGIREWHKVRQLPEVEYPEHAINKPQAARLMAEENTLRVLRVQRAAVRGGLQIGTLAGVFFAAQITSQYAREVRDVWNIVFGGGVAGAAAGLMLPYSLLQRLGSAMVWSAAGAAVSYPTGLAQLKLEEVTRQMARSAGFDIDDVEPGSTQEHQTPMRVEMVSGAYMPVLPQSREGTTEDVIRALERSLEKSSTEAPQSHRGDNRNQESTAGAGGGWGAWLAWPFVGQQKRGDQQAQLGDSDLPHPVTASATGAGIGTEADSPTTGTRRPQDEALTPNYNTWPFNLRGRG